MLLSILCPDILKQIQVCKIFGERSNGLDVGENWILEQIQIHTI